MVWAELASLLENFTNIFSVGNCLLSELDLVDFSFVYDDDSRACILQNSCVLVFFERHFLTIFSACGKSVFSRQYW